MSIFVTILQGKQEPAGAGGGILRSRSISALEQTRTGIQCFLSLFSVPDAFFRTLMGGRESAGMWQNKAQAKGGEKEFQVGIILSGGVTQGQGPELGGDIGARRKRSSGAGI